MCGDFPLHRPKEENILLLVLKYYENLGKGEFNMFSIFSNSGQINYGQKQYLLDFESDIAELPANATPGDIAFVIETSKTMG